MGVFFEAGSVWKVGRGRQRGIRKENNDTLACGWWILTLVYFFYESLWRSFQASISRRFFLVGVFIALAFSILSSTFTD